MHVMVKQAHEIPQYGFRSINQILLLNILNRFKIIADLLKYSQLHINTLPIDSI